MTYEYRCDRCSHEWQQQQRITEEPERTCPKCGQDSARRLVSGGGGFRLAGRGWARDGYGS